MSGMGLKIRGLLLLSATLAFVGCQSGVTNIPISPGSELGKQMLEMDAKGRAVQNAPVFSKALQDYEVTHGGNCTNVAFDHLLEPGEKISRYERKYAMEGVSPICGSRIYAARITFDDAANTVANKVEILEGADVPNQNEEPSYRQKAQELIQYAQSGDLQKMLAITSSLSQAKGGKSMHTLYAEDVIPQFQGEVVTWGDQSIHAIDESNNGGLIFTGTTRGKKTFSFEVGVFKENGKLVIIEIQKHH
jgi:hypothetical protein